MKVNYDNKNDKIVIKGGLKEVTQLTANDMEKIIRGEFDRNTETKNTEPYHVEIEVEKVDPKTSDLDIMLECVKQNKWLALAACSYYTGVTVAYDLLRTLPREFLSEDSKNRLSAAHAQAMMQKYTVNASDNDIPSLDKSKNDDLDEYSIYPSMCSYIFRTVQKLDTFVGVIDSCEELTVYLNFYTGFLNVKKYWEKKLAFADDTTVNLKYEEAVNLLDTLLRIADGNLRKNRLNNAKSA